MLASADDKDKDEEEKCLLFVALSRARDVLCLSRSGRYGSQNGGPSSLVLAIGDLPPARPDGPVAWPSYTSAPGP
jgi:hypothetical protein